MGPFRHTDAPLLVVISDVDAFESLNETFEHQAADYVLQQVAQLMKREARACDFVALGEIAPPTAPISP